MTFQQRVHREWNLLRIEVRRKRQVRQVFPVISGGIPPAAVRVQRPLLLSIKRQVPVSLVKLAGAAHLLKGSIAIFGASKAAAVARNLEAIGRAGNLAEAAGALQSLESEFAFLQQELRTIQSPPELKAKRKSKPRAQGRARSRPNH